MEDSIWTHILPLLSMIGNKHSGEFRGGKACRGPSYLGGLEEGSRVDLRGWVAQDDIDCFDPNSR